MVGIKSWDERFQPFPFRRLPCCPVRSPCSSRRSIAFWQEMTRDMGGPYRPERHYMRGPGPKYRAKHGLPPALIPPIFSVDRL